MDGVTSRVKKMEMAFEKRGWEVPAGWMVVDPFKDDDPRKYDTVRGNDDMYMNGNSVWCGESIESAKLRGAFGSCFEKPFNTHYVTNGECEINGAGGWFTPNRINFARSRKWYKHGKKYTCVVEWIVAIWTNLITDTTLTVVTDRTTLSALDKAVNWIAIKGRKFKISDLYYLEKLMNEYEQESDHNPFVVHTWYLMLEAVIQSDKAGALRTAYLDVLVRTQELVKKYGVGKRR